MIDRLMKIFPEIALWAALTLAAAAFFAFASATALRQFADGLLITSVTLLVTTTLFELVWQAVVDALDGQRIKQGRHRR